MTWNIEAADDFQEIYKGPPPKQYFSHVQRIVKKYGWERSRPYLRAYMRETPLQFLSIPKVLAVKIESAQVLVTPKE